MKCFLIKLVAFLLMMAILIVPMNVWIDPYNVFHADHIRDNGVEPNKNFVKTNYVIKNPEYFDSYLFGSSRVGFLDVEKMTGGTYYNMMYSEGLPLEHLHSIQNMVNQGEIPKHVIIGLDDISYMVDPEFHKGQLYRLEYPFSGSLLEKIGFYGRYLDAITTLQSIPIIRAYGEGQPDKVERFYQTGTEDLNHAATFPEGGDVPYWADYYNIRIDEVMLEIQEIVNFCEKEGIELTFFTNPIHATTYTADIANQYFTFLEELAKVTPYYNFSGFNDVTTNNDYYYETSHYRSSVGDLIIEAIFQESVPEHLKNQGFGVLVTPENQEEVIGLLKQQAETRNLPY